MSQPAPTGEPADPYLRSLVPHIEALETALGSLAREPTAALTILRLAEVIERGSEQHGFMSICEAARQVRAVELAKLAEASDQLLYAMLGARVHPNLRLQTILVVDDDTDLTKLLSAILAAPNRRIEVANTGTQILEALRNRRLDLMVLDLGLPDLDGRMVLASLRKNPLTAGLPVVVVSASSERWVEAECLALGAAAFISKPFDPVKLGTRVSELLAISAVTPKPVSPPAPAADVAPAREAGPVEILLAEADPLTAQIIRHRLSREGHTVRHFASGTAALQAAQHLTPGLVILDAMTPGIEGIELLTRLRAMPAYKKVPILILSDIGSEREVVRALGAGADDCMRKPFSPAELVARIERLLERR